MTGPLQLAPSPGEQCLEAPAPGLRRALLFVFISSGTLLLFCPGRSVSATLTEHWAAGVGTSQRSTLMASQLQAIRGTSDSEASVVQRKREVAIGHLPPALFSAFKAPVESTIEGYHQEYIVFPHDPSKSNSRKIRKRHGLRSKIVERKKKLLSSFPQKKTPSSNAPAYKIRLFSPRHSAAALLFFELPVDSSPQYSNPNLEIWKPPSTAATSPSTPSLLSSSAEWLSSSSSLPSSVSLSSALSPLPLPTFPPSSSSSSSSSSSTSSSSFSSLPSPLSFFSISSSTTSNHWNTKPSVTMTPTPPSLSSAVPSSFSSFSTVTHTAKPSISINDHNSQRKEHVSLSAHSTLQPKSVDMQQTLDAGTKLHNSGNRKVTAHHITHVNLHSPSYRRRYRRSHRAAGPAQQTHNPDQNKIIQRDDQKEFHKSAGQLAPISTTVQKRKRIAQRKKHERLPHKKHRRPSERQSSEHHMKHLHFQMKTQLSNDHKPIQRLKSSSKCNDVLDSTPEAQNRHWSMRDQPPQSAREDVQLHQSTGADVGLSGPWCRSVYDEHVIKHLLRIVCRNVSFGDVSPRIKLKIPDVDTLRLQNSDFPGLMAAVDGKSRSAKVTHLFVENSSVTNINEVLHVVDASNLITLYLEKNLLSTIRSEEFHGATSLEKLDLSYNRLKQVKSDAFASLSALKDLDMRFNALEKLPRKMFNGNPKLHDLKLDNNRISIIHNDTFAGLHHLWILELSHNLLGSELARHKEPFTQCPELKTLHLSHCLIYQLGDDTFDGLKQLKFLDLSNNDLVSIPDNAFKDLSNLTSLYLHSNRLLTVSMKWPLPHSLKHLFLYNNSVSEVDEGAFDGLDLDYIYLAMNKLQALPSKVQLYLVTRKNISLGNNPWRCDCNLVYLIHAVQATPGRHTGTKCATVATVGDHRLLSGDTGDRRMAYVPISQLECPVSPDCSYGRQCYSCRKGLQRRIRGSCVCMEGTQPSNKMGTACEACPQHYYKSTSGNERCQRCSPGSMATQGPTSMCSCAAGYQNNARGDCQKCPPGTYRLYGGVGPCSSCNASGPRLLHAQAQCEDHTLQMTLRPQQEADSHPSGRELIQHKTSQNKDYTSSSIAVGAVCLALFGALLVAVFCLYRGRRSGDLRFLGKMKQVQHSPPMVARVTYSSCDDSGLNGGLSMEVCSRQSNFRRALCVREVGAMIGRGAFGQVFEATAYLTAQDKDPTKVAIKKLKDMASSEEIKNFRLELEQMLNVGPHPNIIGLYGSVMHDGQLCIVMEYAELGDLLTYLRTDVTSPTQYVRVASNGHVIEQTTPEVQDNALLMMFAWQICKGMRHLEMHRYIHRDLAARNCLLTRGPVAKVSDFGLSKDAYELGHYKRVQKDRVPFKWLSPEALLWGQYSSKSDVWAFGILLWELYTFGGTPYPQVTTEQLRELHENGYRLSRPPACPEQLYRIMRSCWRDDARQRPSFKQLEQTLDALIQRTRGREYLELNPHSQHSGLSFTTEDMDDKMTSVDFVRRHRRQVAYENQNDVEHVTLNYTSIGHVSGDMGPSESFQNSADDSESNCQLNSKSTVTSGFQSMSSAHTM